MDKLELISKMRAKDSGFSIIEVIIAMTIILMTLSASIFVSFGNQNFLIGEKTNSEALEKAQELLEQAQASARKDFKMVNPINVATDGIYKKWTDVEPSSVITDYFTKLVTSHVIWTDDSNMTRNLQLSSLITNFENAVGGDTCNSFLTGDWANPQTTNFDFANLVGDIYGAYPITALDAYQGKLYVAVNAPRLSSGPNDPATAMDDNIIGTLAWNNPDAVIIEDNINASASLSGAAITHYLKAQNFGFNIPRGATILGIRVDIFRNASGNTASNAVIDNQVRLIKGDGTIGATNKASSARWSAVAQTDAQYGGISDLWDETDWSPENINSSDFGVVLAVTGTSASTNRLANVDNIQVTVTYIKEFYIFDISNPTNPTLIAGLNNNADIATGFNAVATDGKYAYVATNAGPASGQLQIIDVSSATPFIVNTFIIPGVFGSGGQAIGRSISFRDGYVYLGLTKTASGPEFNIIDVRNPSSPQLIGGFSIGSAINAIYARGNYAFTAHPVSGMNAEQLTVLDISDPSNPFRISGFNDSGGIGGNGKSLFTVGNTLYLGRTGTNISGPADTLPEFYALDGSNLSATLSILGSLPLSASGDSINKILVRDYLAFLLTNSQIQIRKIAQGSPWTFSQYAIPIPLPNSGVGAALDCEGNYLYSASAPTSGAFLDKGAISITTSI